MNDGSDMRPNVDVPESEQFECVGCGTRLTSPSDRVCPDCGGEVRNLTNSRDL
ncbi:rubrerythrin-like domain-containing protein [Halomicrobium salinisoli]|uniref:rubrerythrin-like domain-containing protein n=1 Tax=Halomicrobium salinisoli TaxID=2878391 RepID=UPI0030845C35